MKTLKEEIQGYGVLVKRKDGSVFLASAASSVRYIALNREDAVARKNELQGHLDCKCKVVRLTATFSATY